MQKLSDFQTFLKFVPKNLELSSPVLWKGFEIKSHQRRAHYLNSLRNCRWLAVRGGSWSPLPVWLGLRKYSLSHIFPIKISKLQIVAINNGSFLHALSWRSVWKNCPSVIWKFSCVSRLKNGSQGSFWGRGRRPRPRNDPRLCLFNQDTLGKMENYTRIIF